MATDISEFHVLKFADDVQAIFQQEGSRLRECVQVKTGIIGKSFSTNAIGIVEAATKDTRHEVHSHQDPDHIVRWGNLVYYYNSLMMDPDDDDRVLADPRNKYVMAAASSLGRRTDRTIITAGLGTAITGEDRSGTQALPSAQVVTGSTSGLTVAKLRTAKRILDQAEAPDTDRYAGITAQGLEDLLAATEVTSSDYNNVKALVHGDVNTFLGFQFKRTELFPIGEVTSLVRRGMIWHKSAIELGISRDNYSRIALRRDMHDAWETYTAKDLGAVRKWDNGVVGIDYLEVA